MEHKSVKNKNKKSDSKSLEIRNLRWQDPDLILEINKQQLLLNLQKTPGSLEIVKEWCHGLTNDEKRELRLALEL